ncbi:unnamed protein product [Rhizoctonia solani]|uniref:Peptidase C14 caspase domain-containing protein n=1 Tax=Rhizoctonia solani TaxID=456999 RepID=A0A8H3GLW8_9AGAM|nr:unnamed protein product [Rhizoctonia solani]
MGFTTIIFIASLGLLRMPHSLVITHTKPANALVPKDHVSASTASTAGQLMLPEDIVFYGNLIFVALMISRLYSFILGHEKSSRTRSIPPLPRETYDYLTTKDQVASEFVRPDSRIRGPSKPAVQVQGIPTYLEKLAHSPTEEHTSHVFGASTSAPTQNAESRGRMDAVAKSSAADRSVPVSSAQSAIPKDRAGGATTRLSSRKKTYTQPEKPENALLGSLRGFQLRSEQNTLVHVLAVGLSWRHIQKKALPGPEHDLCWLKNFFVDQKRVQFTSLLDNEVSFDTIHRSVTRIYSDAQPNDCLVLYFTGHGDDENAFELYDDDPGSLDEVILNDWIVKLRRETSKTIPVYIIFDFCRENPASSSAQLDNGVTVFWSCPPGQKSPDVMLSKDLPYSCFLLALFLAIDDSSKSHTSHTSHTVQYFVFAHLLGQAHGAESDGVVIRTRAIYVGTKGITLVMELGGPIHGVLRLLPTCTWGNSSTFR